MSTELVHLQETLYTSSNPTRRWLHCSRRDWIIEALEAAAKRGNSLALEIGPGSGVYVPTLSRLFHKVVVTDIEKAYLSHASAMVSALGNLSVEVDDITKSKLPDGQFDVVLCTEVIEHIPDSRPALAEIRRIIRQNGVLILSTPQRYSPLELAARIAFLPGAIQIVRLIYGEPVLPTGHINLLTEAEVRRQLRDAHFTVLQQHKSGMYIPLLAEFGGERALRLEQRLEKLLSGGRFDGLLWTQFYVATPC